MASANSNHFDSSQKDDYMRTQGSLLPAYLQWTGITVTKTNIHAYSATTVPCFTVPLQMKCNFININQVTVDLIQHN